MNDEAKDPHTVSGSRMVRQSRFQLRKKASWRVSCRCSTSGIGSSGSSSSGSGDTTSVLAGSTAGLQVAADGMAGPERPGRITRPSVAKIDSASSATAAIARARSSLNCRRSALRLVVISSEVSSKWRVENLCFRTNGYPGADFEKDRRLTFSSVLPDIYLPC